MYIVTPSLQCSFWQRTKFQPSPRHNTLQILLHLSSGSPKSQDVAKKFSSMEKIQQNMTADLTAIPDEDFQQW
jgi:hypothetical protein